MTSMQCELWMFPWIYIIIYDNILGFIVLLHWYLSLPCFSSNFQENVIFGGNKIWRQQILAELNLAVFRQSPILVPVKYKCNKVLIILK